MWDRSYLITLTYLVAGLMVVLGLAVAVSIPSRAFGLARYLAFDSRLVHARAFIATLGIFSLIRRDLGHRKGAFLLIVIALWGLLPIGCTQAPTPLASPQHMEPISNAATPTDIAEAWVSPPPDPTPPPEPSPELTPEPPLAILRIAEEEQLGGIGSYCWTEPTDAETAVSLCADTVGIPTTPQPLSVRAPFTASFSLPLSTPPDELALTLIPVTAQDRQPSRARGWAWWEYQSGQRYSLPLASQPTIELSPEPGLYVLNLFARWGEKGDVSYGFLVRVELTPSRTGSPVITWQYTDESGGCLQARIGREWLETGDCDQLPAVYPLGERRQAELAQFLDTFSSFEADTQAGRVTFKATNQGLNQVPFPAQERMLAYWAWVVTQEAASRQVPGWSLALEWQRDDGRWCEKLQVFLTGFAEAFSCEGGELVELGWMRLEASDLSQLYDWYDRFETTRAQQFEVHGRGPARPDKSELEAIDRYAESLFATSATIVPGAAGTPIEPFAIAPYIRFESWSPDGQWMAYWSSSQQDVDNQVPYTMPGGTLHLANPESGQVCAVAQFHTETDGSASVQWGEDGSAIVVVGQEAFRGMPCQVEPFRALADYTPQQNESPDPAISPDGRYRATTALVSSQNGILTLDTSLTPSRETGPSQSVTWQIDERLGDHGLGGEWVSPTQFLIYETLSEGPLLIDIQQGVISVLSELFGLHEIPSIRDEEGYSLQAMAAPGVEPDTFHLALSGVGLEAIFPAAMLYHAESGQVERLPYPTVWGFGADYEWLFLYQEVFTISFADGGRNSGYHLWARRLEDLEGRWQLIAPALDYLLWRENASEMAFTQNETSVVWQTFPEGQPMGRWHTGDYWVHPAAFSPDGRHLVALGNLPGRWEYGLFVLVRGEDQQISSAH